MVGVRLRKNKLSSLSTPEKIPLLELDDNYGLPEGQSWRDAYFRSHDDLHFMCKKNNEYCIEIQKLWQQVQDLKRVPLPEPADADVVSDMNRDELLKDNQRLRAAIRKMVEKGAAHPMWMDYEKSGEGEDV